jgi:hypothetical protein
MIKIVLGALFDREMREITVVVIVMQKGDSLSSNKLDNGIRDRGLTRTGSWKKAIF